MTERDQFGGALGRHDAGKPRHREHVALGDIARGDAGERLLAHHDAGARHRHPVGLRLVRDVDHSGAALGVEMGEFGQVEQPPRRRRDIGLAHQGFADEEAPRPRLGEPVEVVRRADAAFGDDDAVGRDFGRQPFGGPEIDGERLQVAVVDAEKPHA